METVDGLGAIDTGNARFPSTKVMEDEDLEDEGLLHDQNGGIMPVAHEIRRNVNLLQTGTVPYPFRKLCETVVMSVEDFEFLEFPNR